MKCSRTEGAYPVQLHKYLASKDIDFDFTNIPCSGATTKEIFNQAAELGEGDKHYELITLSAGGKIYSSRKKNIIPQITNAYIIGNDLGFSDIVKKCYYVLVDDPKTSATELCNAALDNADKIMHGKEFMEDYQNLVNHITYHLSDRGQLLVTGYAPFFDTDTTLCDNVTWGLNGHVKDPVKLIKKL